MDYNKFSGEGRLVEDPQEYTVASGKHIVKFSIAQNVMYRDSGVNFFECVAWEPVSSFALRFRKGETVHIEGMVEINEWTDKNGNKRKSWTINVRECWWCGRKADNERANERAAKKRNEDIATVDKDKDEIVYDAVDDEDLPF